MNKVKIYSIIMGLLLVATGCTNNSSNPAPAVDNQNLVSQGDGNFGVVEFNSSLVKSFTFRNDSSSSISLTPEIVGGHFDQVSLGCQNVAPNRSCLVKVLFNANKESGVYTGQLKVGSLTMSLTAEITSVPNVSYKFFIDGTETTGPLGTLSGNNLKLMNVKIKNNSPKTGNPSSLTSSSNKFNLIYNTCSNISLKPNQSCYAKLVVKGDNSGISLATNLTFDSQGPSLSLIQEVANLDSNLQPINSEVVLGDVYKEGENRVQILTIENQGKSSGTISNIVVPPGFYVVSNNCLNVKPGYKCLVKVVYQTSNIPTGQYNNQIDLGDDTSVNVTVNQVTNPNKLDKVELLVSEDVLVNTCTPVTVTLKDVDNLDFVTSQSISLVTNEPLFQDSNCSTPDSSLAEFEPSKTFYIKKSVSGVINLQVSYSSKTAQKNINWYDSLSASAAPIIITNQSTVVSVIGGKPPYQYSVQIGDGTISGPGSYQSPTDGDMTIKVEDSLNLSTTVAIKVVKPLQLVAQKSTQVVSTNQNFSVTGGLAPFTYSVTGGGTINSSTGLFTAPATATSVVVKVVDSSNQSSQLTITVVPVLTISPLTDKIVTNNSKTFIGSGGVLPYVYTVTGVGSINSATGVFSSGTITGSSVVKVTDAIGQEATASVIIVAPLTLTAAKPNQIVNTQQNLTAAGGLAPYSYSIVSGLGSVNSTSGVYSAGANAGTVNFKVTDDSGQTANISVNVVSVLTISPSSASLIVAGTYSFSGVGGLAPYSYAIVSGNGLINPTSGLFTASNTAGATTIRVTDALNQTADAVATVSANITIAGNCSYAIPETMPCTVTATGGIGAKTYTTNVGTINATTGEFKGVCVNNVGSSIVTATDQYGNSAQTTLTYPCVYKSCNQIRAEGYGIADGNYWLDVDALNSGQDPFSVYCGLNDADGGGWTMIASGGSTCVAGAVNNMTEKTSGLSFTNCGYTPRVLVQALAQNINSVRLRSGLSHSNFEQVVSVKPNAINALKNNTSWHNGASSEWTGSTWIWGTMNGCGTPSATAWPNMYHSCDNGNGVHWLVAGTPANHYRRYNTPSTDVASSTWIKSAYYKVGRSCLDAKNRGLKNHAGTLSSGTYTIDPDGFGFGYAPFDVYCDQETADGGWTNIAPIMGTIPNVMIGTSIRINAGGGSPNASISRMGINPATVATSLINGSVASYSQPNGTCGVDFPALQLSTEIISLLQASKVKVDSRSWFSAGSGSAACGGALAGADITGLTAIDPVNFNLRYLSTCSNDAGLRWWEYTNSSYWHYTFSLNSLVNPVVSSIYVNCGTGTSNIQIRSIMVK